MKLHSIATSSAVAVAGLAMSILPAVAASTVVVTPGNTQGWYNGDTRGAGDYQFVADATAPAGSGALELTTTSDTADKVQYLHDTETPLSDVSEISYYTKQNSASFAQGDPSYQLQVNLNGDDGGFTTLVFEPYWNTDQGAVVNGQWQQWDVADGQLWSSKTVTCSNGTIIAGAGGPPLYTLSEVETICPEAVVTQFGVNVGSYNPDYNVETDLVSFNGTAYDFELSNLPGSKDACKDGGYQNLTDIDGNTFRNQGQCVSYFNHL